MARDLIIKSGNNLQCSHVRSYALLGTYTKKDFEYMEANPDAKYTPSGISFSSLKAIELSYKKLGEPNTLYKKICSDCSAELFTALSL